MNLDALIFAWYHFIVYEAPEVEIAILRQDLAGATWHVYEAITRKLFRLIFPNKLRTENAKSWL